MTVVALAGLAIHTLRSGDINANWMAVGLIGLLGGATLQFLNSAEFFLMMRIAQKPINFSRSANITLLSTIVNQLPIPGSLAVRATAMRQDNVDLRSTAKITLNVAVNYISLSVLVAGTAEFIVGSPNIAALLVVLGASGLALSIQSLQVGLSSYRDPLHVTLVELMMLLVGITRLWLILHALGLKVTVAETSFIAVGSTLAVAAGVLPLGLGIREGLVALFSTATSVQPDIAATAALLERGFRMIVVSIVAILILALRNKPTEVERPSNE